MQASAPPIYLTIQDIACERDHWPLYSGLNLCVKAGELWYIKGANGAGKTSLLKQIAGLLPIDQGVLEWTSSDAGDKQEAHTIEYTFVGHKSALKEGLTVAENLSWLGRLQGIDCEIARDKAIHKAGLAGYEDTPVRQLSAGQKRRVALARLQMKWVPVWLLDEPFTAIDRAGVQQQFEWLSEHLEQGGAVILTSHQDVEIDGVMEFDLQQFAPGATERHR